MNHPEFAMRAEGLGKRYRLGETGPHYKTLRETISAPFFAFRRDKSLQ